MSDLGDKLTSKDPVSFFSRHHVEGGSLRWKSSACRRRPSGLKRTLLVHLAEVCVTLKLRALSRGRRVDDQSRT